MVVARVTTTTSRAVSSACATVTLPDGGIPTRPPPRPQNSSQQATGRLALVKKQVFICEIMCCA